MVTKPIHTVRRWILRLALYMLLAAIAASVAVLVIIPRATHGAALTVLTGSMTPKIPVGSVVVDRPVNPGTLRVGDIATYQVAPGQAIYVTHRIIAINAKTSPITFTFKGDANPGPDIHPVPATAIRGQVWFHVPYIGGIRDKLQAGGRRATLIRMAVLALGLFAALQLISVVRKPRGEGPEPGLQDRRNHAAEPIDDVSAPAQLGADGVRDHAEAGGG